MNEGYIEKDDRGLTDDEILQALETAVAGRDLKRVILVPPDYTRLNSKAGFITAQYYRMLRARGCQVDVLPALGSHMAMTEAECLEMFGPEIPYEDILVHNYKEDCIPLGTIEAEFVEKVTGGEFSMAIPVEISRRLTEVPYDLIISIGQVVPHEVMGFANYAKNFMVGCGGYEMISRTHIIGAVYGMERILAQDSSPIRKIVDEAFHRYLSHLPILFVMTVTTMTESKVRVHGLFIGDDRQAFEDAVDLSRKINVYYVDKPIKKAIAYMEPKEFKTSWLANKALYRLRMAMEPGGELIVLAPGMYQFGETEANNALIQKYGYTGKQHILHMYETNEDLQQNMPVTFHLIHGSIDGKFRLTYAVEKLDREAIEKAGYQYADYQQMVKQYRVDQLAEGWNVTAEGEEIYYVGNPALGLWIYEKMNRYPYRKSKIIERRMNYV